ncbi:hypothetical protein CEUSTIGMA_g1653.t1 [Chlamydomonas eustigma]|uniref:Alpha-taxilin n=1 Tax=Chlamydomonas eustigma TaxID=1157962 RepID=A0A250WTQ4_9CHLO|nr:hypothetical protein CEUSTIGMA_g1653.t1 [Chlamydomonas eustigma]|eukprot:GAX74204.1 hypothetical protein CEUSTIGMA_g1653.t1 [Chlamydomonas eustigma]
MADEEIQSPSSPEDITKAPHEPEVVVSAVKKTKGKDDLSTQFANVLTSKITELEKGLNSSNPAEREASKMRRKALRELQKYVTDKSIGIEDKIAYVQSKYTIQVTEFLKMEKHYLEVQKELDTVTKERDKVQVELRKTNTLRDRLEELCRQLQRENRDILEESKRRQEDELKQRQAIQQKFSQAIEDVTSKMDIQQAERARQAEENEALRVKLGDVLQQFDTYTQLITSKDLEVKLSNAKLEQQQALSTQILARIDLLQNANDSLSKMNEVMKEELEHHFAVKQQNAFLQEANKDLKTQLDTYADRFSEFHSTITKSNEAFVTLRKEMDSSNKKRSHLLKEHEVLKRRHEKSEEENTLLRKQMERIKVAATITSEADSGADTASMAVNGSDVAEEVRKLRLQKDRLEGLCRALQAQVKAYKSGSSPEVSFQGLAGDGNRGSDSSQSSDLQPGAVLSDGTETETGKSPEEVTPSLDRIDFADAQPL